MQRSEELVAEDIFIAQFIDRNTGVLNYNIYLLSRDGKVYVNGTKDGGFRPLDMRVLPFRSERR